MMRRLLALTPLLILTACASASTTHSWSCRATGSDTCASIAQIDRRDQPKSEPGTIFGGQVARWWDQKLPTSATREDAPRRESDQTMRIVIAPYIDAAGDYHDRSQVYVVMRRAQWWIAPPVPLSASPAPGSELKPETREASPTSASAGR